MVENGSITWTGYQLGYPHVDGESDPCKDNASPLHLHHTEQLAKNPGDTFNELGRTVPTSSNYFFSYIILQTLFVSSSSPGWVPAFTPYANYQALQSSSHCDDGVFDETR
ncbi:hypothetical protein Vi05172_g7303 [Venturia inaequalis]|nr:hypothetical protein Vi05172_g7303 [Venturia inaequalis]